MNIALKKALKELKGVYEGTSSEGLTKRQCQCFLRAVIRATSELDFPDEQIMDYIRKTLKDLQTL